MTSATSFVSRDNTAPSSRGSFLSPPTPTMIDEATTLCAHNDRDLDSGVAIEIHSTRAEFDALEDDWNELYARAGKRSTIFQSFNWNWHWCNNYLPAAAATEADAKTKAKAKAPDAKTGLAIVTARVNGTLTMLWPLAHVTTLGLQQLIWMGDPVTQYGDVLCDQSCNDTDLLAACWSHLQQTIKADLICLRKVRQNAVITPLLERLQATVTDRQEAVSHTLADHADYADYAKRFKPRALRNRRRQMRRLEELGAVTFKEFKGGLDAKSITEQAIAMKRDWLKQKGLVSRAYADQRFDNFFADIALGASHPSNCVVSVLTCGEKIAAVEVGLNDDSCRYMHIIVYNNEFEKYGAGAHHMQNSIQGAFDTQLKTFDMLAPNTRYKTEWGDEVMPVFDYAIGLNLKGRAYVRGYLNLIRQNAKLIYNRLPPKLIKFITSQ